MRIALSSLQTFSVLTGELRLGGDFSCARAFASFCLVDIVGSVKVGVAIGVPYVNCPNYSAKDHKHL